MPAIGSLRSLSSSSDSLLDGGESPSPRSRRNAKFRQGCASGQKERLGIEPRRLTQGGTQVTPSNSPCRRCMTVRQVTVGLCDDGHRSTGGFERCWGQSQEASMTLTILDPRTGQKVTISIPDTPSALR
jgi:hypothetical protein